LSEPRRERDPQSGVPWRVAFRLNSFRQADGDVVAALRRALAVPGVTAVELNFPQHFRDLAETELAGLLAESGLPLTALNVRFDDTRFRRGAFTAPESADRRAALDWSCQAVATATRFGAPHVVLWMENDGWDYPLQAHYDSLWRDEVAGLRAVAQHDPTVRVSVEYKPFGSRRRALIRSMSDALLAARDVALPNFGVTLDVCHSYMAGEHPAAAAAAALREGKLFGVHLNDGGGQADDGLSFGSIHECDALELIAVLREGGYAGTVYFDTFPKREEPPLELAANIATLRKLVTRAASIAQPALARAQAAQDALAVHAVIENP
jgi:xylose isomerase